MFEYWKTPEYARMLHDGADARIAGAAMKEGCKTLEDFITGNTETALLRIPNLGRKSVDKIKEIAVAKGLRLGFKDGRESQPVRCIHNQFYPCAMQHTTGCRPATADELWTGQAKPAFGPVQQEWVLEIPFMQQSVLFAAIRAPDGLRKDHPTKVLLRWYRRCILYSAFDRRALTCPFEEGGGSFTGPFALGHVLQFLVAPWRIDAVQAVHNNWHYARGAPKHAPAVERQRKYRWKMFDKMRDVYLRHVDEMPHHFQLHFMHAAQIVGCHHPSTAIREWWREFYLMIVNDAHLSPETDADMNLRLSDNSDAWKAREWSPAK